MHKGNIMKFTEGAFRDWGYELVKREYAGRAIGWDDCGGKPPPGQLLVKDSIADITLQQVLTRPDEFDVIATMNLNGDYLSDALAAQVGGIGIAPGANINYADRPRHLRGDPRHRAEVRRPGQGEPELGDPLGRDDARPPRLGRGRAADRERHLARDRSRRRVTYDFHRLMDGATLLKCTEFGDAIIANMDARG